MNKQIKKVLNDVGFTKHYSSRGGGLKNAKEIRWYLYVFEELLSWTYSDFRKKSLLPQHAIDWLIELTQFRYSTIGNIVDYWNEVREHKVATMRTKIVVLNKVFKWAVMFRFLCIRISLI